MSMGYFETEKYIIQSSRKAEVDKIMIRYNEVDLRATYLMTVRYVIY